MKKIGLVLPLFFLIFAGNVFSQPVISTKADRLIVDFGTTENEDEKVYCTFHDSATVSYQRGGSTFLRLDGLLGKTSEVSELIIDLITHYDSDHVNRALVEQCLRDGSFNRLIAPYPDLESSRNAVFSILEEHAQGTEQDTEGNRILDISPDGQSLNLTITDVGDFSYSSFQTDGDIFVEMYKYHKPRSMNTDGLIFRISHKNISYLLFGDFDDPAGIENLLDVFTIRADIVKWPHHAHKFANNKKTDEILKKMNEKVNPFYIIWEPYQNQKGFPDYIERFDFRYKFLCSEDMEIQVISFFRIEHFLPLG